MTRREQPPEEGVSQWDEVDALIRARYPCSTWSRGKRRSSSGRWRPSHPGATRKRGCGAARRGSSRSERRYKTVAIITPLLELPVELEKEVTVLHMRLPGIDELSELLDRILAEVKDNPHVRVKVDAASRKRLLRAALGFTLSEAENVFARIIVSTGVLDGNDVSAVLAEKKQIIAKAGLVEYFEAQEDFSQVGGLEELKEWLVRRGQAFSDKARELGLPPPRGILLLGVQGCGKSLCAKAVSSRWNLPLLRFDIGRMFGSLVGSSEENMRRAIQVAESVAPALLWVDGIDKAFAGVARSGGSDGGTSSCVFGTFLTWLSEKKSSVFVIATANNIQELPPELLRKGRLDEIFFVDLPVQAGTKEKGMSVSVIIVPVIVTSWPTILPVLTAAVAAMGFSMRRDGLNAAAGQVLDASVPRVCRPVRGAP